ncbi:hypothetical protein [Herminiimonas sp. CN]|uniref:hypothetical protein n=1 Tax=Herminiimonas sp. CN TaxID=1349818 RepID=UPI0004737C5D|nr:hypothetical protein [Herminiimonas sp. CN]
MNTALLFGSTFGLVLALGLQQQFVTNDHYFAAFSNSLLISLGQLGMLQVIHARGPAEYAAYMLGGPFGIVCSMALYRRHFKRGG